jgi:leader peptidase (prepilin peptidase)/N-methyltransferase
MFLTTLFVGVPISLLYAIVFGFGVIIGSFLNVYIYRFHTGKSLSGHSHCLSCATPLKWYELFPLVSYLVLRGRCRTCGCKIPGRYFLVELATGLLFIGGSFISSSLVEMGIFWFIFSVLLVITVYDLYHFIIPDALTLALTGAVVGLLAYTFISSGMGLEQVVWSIATALGGASFFLLLWVVSKGRWLGFGDVKLAFPLSLLVGPLFVFSFIILSFWIGAAISLGILAFAKIKSGQAGLQLPGRRLTMKSAVPFAPFLVASCLTILFTQINVLELFSFA